MVDKDKSHKPERSSVETNSANQVADKSPPTRLVDNQLHFRTNSTTILPYLKAKADGNSGHPRFTLNSIITLPKVLVLPINDEIIQLSVLNISLPILDEKIKAQFLANWMADYHGKQPPPILSRKVEKIRQRLHTKKYPQSQMDLLDQAESNYEKYGFFCQFDWCMDHWGTPADIQGVTESTFELPTSFLQFQTVSTPPIMAVQQLANTFPSVLFTLLFSYRPEATRHEVQFYPFPPFGY
jgi:hypothetical protein